MSSFTLDMIQRANELSLTYVGMKKFRDACVNANHPTITLMVEARNIDGMGTVPFHLTIPVSMIKRMLDEEVALTRQQLVVMGLALRDEE